MKKHLNIIACIVLLLCLSLILSACGGVASVVGTHYDAEGNLILEMSDGSTVNAGRYEAPADDENPQGLDFYPLSDGTYGVSVGNARYLKEITVPATYKGKAVTKILNEAFTGCALLRIDLPDTITEIGEKAFYSCTGLISVTLPTSLKEIGEDAFLNCNRLIEVENRSSLTVTAKTEDHGHVGFYAQNVYTSLPGDSKLFTTPDGFVFFDGDSENYLMGYLGSADTLTLPADCNGSSYELHSYSFCGETTLTHVTLSDKTTAIGAHAFLDCTALKRIDIPDSVTKFGTMSFGNCTQLEQLTIPPSVTAIHNSMFYNCHKLRQYENDVCYVGKWAIRILSDDPIFRPDTIGIGETAGEIGDRTITKIELPDSVKYLCDNAFYYCSKLTEIVIPASVEQISVSALPHDIPSIYYKGDGSNTAAWENVSTNPIYTTLYYYAEEAPAESGNYWHYVDGVPTPW